MNYDMPMNDNLKMLAGLSQNDPQKLKLKTLREFEHDYIKMVIQLCDNNIPRAAKILDVSASTLYRRFPVQAQDEWPGN